MCLADNDIFAAGLEDLARALQRNYVLIDLELSGRSMPVWMCMNHHEMSLKMYHLSRSFSRLANAYSEANSLAGNPCNSEACMASRELRTALQRNKLRRNRVASSAQACTTPEPVSAKCSAASPSVDQPFYTPASECFSQRLPNQASNLRRGVCIQVCHGQ